MKEKMQTQERILMVVDIGGSKYMPGFVDGSGNILYQERREWTAAEPEAIVGQLKEALHHICARYPELAKKAATWAKKAIMEALSLSVVSADENPKRTVKRSEAADMIRHLAL